MFDQTERLGFRLLRRDKEALRRLASAEGEAMAVVVRRLIRMEAERCGLWPIQKAREPGKNPEERWRQQ